MVSLKEMAWSDEEHAPPAWLRTLLETTFFDACPEHPASEGRANRRTTGCNFFCTHCAGRALCFGCLGNHEGHELIQVHRTVPLCRGKGGLVPAFETEIIVMLALCEVQIRKSSGHNVVKVDDVQHLLSMSLVQTYLYNGGYVVFLNRRPMLGQGKHGASHCEECERGLQDEACRFCSIGCKVRHLSRSIHAARFFFLCIVKCGD
jgi:hypothetical protein